MRHILTLFLKTFSRPEGGWREAPGGGSDRSLLAPAPYPTSPPPMTKGLDGLDGGDPAKVVAALEDKTHNYGALLEPEDINAPAQFVIRGQIDMRAFIDAKTGKVDGEPTRGAVIFQTICAGCHGTEGKEIRTMPPLRAIPDEVINAVFA
jgi:mono/diheme cytochrome c family protein